MKTDHELAIKEYLKLFGQAANGQVRYARWVGNTEWVSDLSPLELAVFCSFVRLAEAAK